MTTNTQIQYLNITGCPSHISLDNINEIEIQPIPGFLKRLLLGCVTKMFFDPHDDIDVEYVRDVKIGTTDCVLSYNKSTNTISEIYSTWYNNPLSITILITDLISS